MTGVEAISTSVPVFKPVEWRNALVLLTWTIGLLIALFGPAHESSPGGVTSRDFRTPVLSVGPGLVRVHYRPRIRNSWRLTQSA
jgi:hypothetical protein